MTSTLKLTRAEFKKIFKRPGVFIMALLLVACIFVSLYIFNPTNIIDPTVNYGENLTAVDYYDNFYNQDLTYSEKGINKTFSKVDNIINYYKISTDRDNNLKDYYASVISSIEELRKVTDPILKENAFGSLKNHLTKFSDAFKNFDSLKTNYPHIAYTINCTTYFSEYSSTLSSFVNKMNSSTSQEIIEIIDTNSYVEKLKNELDYSVNYILPTLNSYAININKAYNEFNKYHSLGTNYLQSMESERKNLLASITLLDEYFKIIIDNEFPIVLINDAQVQEIKSILETSTALLNAVGTNGTSYKLSDYTNLKTELDKIDIANYFTKKFSLTASYPIILQVKLDANTLSDYAKVKDKVNANRVAIKESITSYREDESIKNIQSKITDYSLLASTYESYIMDNTLLLLSSKYNNNDFKSLYGYKLKDFNNYQYTERVTADKYYISNNIYSNSFLTNFTFNQNSENGKTNAYDYMYFTLELCTVIITIFAMMLICNLITSETESGTIKLLLTRPFKRSKIVTAKLFATIFFVLVFMLFSSLITFAGGYFYYGITNSSILVLFNSTSAFTISPLLLMLIDILTLTFDIIFYVIIALMISIICKNYAGSITVCLVLMIATYALNILFGTAFWYSLLPGTNLHLFKYFGNGFTNVATSTTIQNILITPIQSSMSFIYSFLILCAYIVVSLSISYAVFNKRDF